MKPANQTNTVLMNKQTNKEMNKKKQRKLLNYVPYDYNFKYLQKNTAGP